MQSPWARHEISLTQEDEALERRLAGFPLRRTSSERLSLHNETPFLKPIFTFLELRTCVCSLSVVLLHSLLKIIYDPLKVPMVPISCFLSLGRGQLSFTHLHVFWLVCTLINSCTFSPIVLIIVLFLRTQTWNIQRSLSSPRRVCKVANGLDFPQGPLKWLGTFLGLKAPGPGLRMQEGGGQAGETPSNTSVLSGQQSSDQSKASLSED